MTLSRRHTFNEIKDNGDFDVVVIGGGVNGIGVFRELALQGLRVLLVEKNDFCSGCSAAPSRMIHGGLRYLENGEFDLVKESLRERDALLKNAPHMVRPLPTVIPISSMFSGLFNSATSFLGFSGKPAARGLLPIKLGLGLYDWVTRKRRLLPKHSVSWSSKTRAQWPHLTKDAKFAAVYYDAWISHPERLCLELIADAKIAAPRSLAMNYVQLEIHKGAYSVTDMVSGEVVPVRPKVLVNAAGAWVDDVAQDVDGARRDKMVSGTKGSHLILDNPALYQALNGHMVYFENSDGRICIVFPYLGKVLAGSTDIRVDNAGRVKCELAERDYILDSLSLVFDDINIDAADIVFSYSGIRPLPKSDQDFTGRISRGHYVKKIDGPVPQFCMIGGKWTTFRAFGEQAADSVLAELKRPRKLSTEHLEIGGGKSYPHTQDSLERQLVRELGVSAARALHLASHYGTKAQDVHRAAEAVPGNRPLAADTAYSTGEIAHLVETEAVVSISDLVLRRTSLAITGALTAESLDAITDVYATALHLTPQQAQYQRDQLVQELTEFHGIDGDTLASAHSNRRTECV